MRRKKARARQARSEEKNRRHRCVVKLQEVVHKKSMSYTPTYTRNRGTRIYIRAAYTKIRNACAEIRRTDTVSRVCIHYVVKHCPIHNCY